MELYTFMWDINALTVSFGNDLPTTPTYLAAKNVLIYVKSFNSNIESCMQILFPALYRILYLFLKKNHKGKKQQLVQLFGNSTANPCWESFGWKPHEFCRRRLKLCFQSSIAGVWCTYMYIYLTGRSRTSEGKINFKCK